MYQNLQMIEPFLIILELFIFIVFNIKKLLTFKMLCTSILDVYHISNIFIDL